MKTRLTLQILLGVALFFWVSPVRAQMNHGVVTGGKPPAPQGHWLHKHHGIVASAKAVIRATTPGSTLVGRVDFMEKNDGVKIVAHLLNVNGAGDHGFHVHENGSCAESGRAAGSHFNPEDVPHGLLSKDGFGSAHAGDLGNITIDADGSGYYYGFIRGLSLTKGRHNIMGKAVIVHARADDFSQPTGNAGGRIGCGIIEIVK